MNNNNMELIRTLSISCGCAVVAERFTLFCFIVFIRRYFINLCLSQVRLLIQLPTDKEACRINYHCP